MNMLIHPLAERLPSMTPEEYETLRDSIRMYGYKPEFPILLFNGMVLDGRHRYRACQELGVEPYCVTWTGTEEDAEVFVGVANLCRRHLTASQRAIIAAKVFHGTISFERVSTPVGLVADGAGVSPRTLQDAVKVVREMPELVDEIESGKVSVSEAVKAIPPKPKITRDKVGNVVTDTSAAKVIECAKDFEEISARLLTLRREIFDLSKTDQGRMIRMSAIETDINNVHKALKWAKPHAVCPYTTCKTTGCKACGGTGWVNKDVWENIPADIRGE